MFQAKVEGADKLDTVARVLRETGDRELQRELTRGLNRATKTLKDDAKDEAEERLPRKGGLAKRVANAKLSTRRRGGRNPGITIQAKGMAQLGMMDRGLVKHPVFDNRDVWVTQRITAGWFSDPMRAGADDVRRELDDVLDDVARKLARKLDQS